MNNYIDEFKDDTDYVDDTNTVSLRDWQRRAKTFFNESDGCCLFEVSTGAGKCFSPGTEIIMFNGSIKKIEDVIIGDELMGDDSQPRLVTSLASGKEMMYDIIPVKGNKYTVNESHILSLKYTNIKHYKKLKDGTTSIYVDKRSGTYIDISLKQYLKQNKYEKHLLKGYRVPIEYKKQDILIDSYYLGLWLGDGLKNTTAICNPDKIIISYIKKYAEKLNVNFKIWIDKRNNNSNVYAINDKHNTLLNLFKQYNLINNKHIPKQYLINSRENRLQLLAGLLDTDGNLLNNGFEIIQKSNQLTNDILYLARSLGFAAYSSKKIGRIKSINFKGEYNRIYISGNTNLIPTKIKRKQATIRKQKKDVLVTGIKVKSVGIGNYYGFTLSGNNRRFLLKDFTVVHNTFFTIDIIQDLLINEPDLKIIIVVPKNIILETGWYKELVDAGIPIQKIGVYYGDIKEYAQITITNMQNLNKIPLEVFDMFVVDECFSGDTKVTLMHSNKSMKNINGYITTTSIKGIVEQKSKGPVISFNTTSKQFELKQIINWYKIPVKRKLIKIIFDNGIELKVTPDQELYTGQKYISANELSINDKIIYFGENNNIFSNFKRSNKRPCYVKCIKKENIETEEMVYDIEVEDNHNFFANGLLAHNCHNFGTPRLLELVKHPMKYKIGLTATLKRMDNKHYDLLKIFKYNMFKYAPKEALDDGVLNPFIFINIGVKLNIESQNKYDFFTQQLNTIFKQGGNYEKIMRTTSPLKFKMLALMNERKVLVNNYFEKFNIGREIIKHHQDNKIIVFNQYNDQTSKLYWHLLEDNRVCRIIHSGISKEKREESLRDFKNDKFNVLLTSKVLDEGFNIPKLDVAIIMAGDSTDKQTIQRMGRVLRKKKGQNSILYQIYCIDTMEATNANSRSKIFKALASDYKDIEYIGQGSLKLDADN